LRDECQRAWIGRRPAGSADRRGSGRNPTAGRRRAAAGIGGCPHAPGASGNVATEGVAFLIASMSRPTGLDFDRLLAMRSKVAAWLAGEALHSSIARTDLPKTMAAP